MPPRKRKVTQRSPARGVGKKRRTQIPEKATSQPRAPDQACVPTCSSEANRQDPAEEQSLSTDDITPDNRDAATATHAVSAEECTPEPMAEIATAHGEDEIKREEWRDSLSENFDHQIELLYLVKHGEELVRRIFNQYVKPSKLAEKIRKYIGPIKNNLNQLQQERLFPENENDISSNNFDITILIKLIRKMSLDLEPTEGWDIPFPKDEHVSKGDDIQRIYSCRNCVCHMTLHADLEEIPKHKETMLLVIKRLGGDKYANKVFQHISNLTIPRFVSDTEDQYDLPEDENVKENVTDRWKEDDRLYFETHNFEKIFTEITKNRQSTIIGGPGVGKRALVRHLALKFEQQEEYNIVSVKDPAEILSLANPNEKQVFVLEDLSAEKAMSENLLSDFVTFGSVRFNIRNDSKVLITMRTFAYFKAREHCVFLNSSVLDLESRLFSLNDRDKLGIFRSHCKDSKCSREQLLDTEGSMFPALVHMFANDKIITSKGVIFFKEPYEYLYTELQRLKEDRMLHFALLVFSFCEDLSSVGIIKRTCVLSNAYNLEPTVESCIRLLEYLRLCMGAYVFRRGDKFEFLHQSFRDVIAYDVGKDHPDLMLRYMSMDVIGRNVRIGKKCPGGVPYVKITMPTHIQILVKRIYFEMKNGDIYNSFSAQCFSNENFTIHFINFLKKKPFQELKSTFLSKYRVSISRRRGKLFSCQIEDAIFELCQKDMCTSSIPEKFRMILMFVDEKKNTKYNARSLNFNLHKLVSRGCTDLEIVECLLKHAFSVNIAKCIVKFVKPVYSRIKCHSKKKYRTDNRLDVSLCRWVIGHKMIGLFSFLLDQCAIHKDNSFDLFSSSEKNVLFNLAVMSGSRKMVDLVKQSLSISDIQKCVPGPELSPLLCASVAASTGMLADLTKDMKETLEDDEVVSLLIGASFMGDKKLLNMLLKTFDFSSTDTDVGREDDGTTPLIAACMGKKKEVVEHLLYIGADVNICDDYGQSPLYFAALQDSIDIVRILCDAGADPTLTTDFSSSAIKIAELHQYSDIVMYLVEEAIPRWNDRQNQEIAMHR